MSAIVDSCETSQNRALKYAWNFLFRKRGKAITPLQKLVHNEAHKRGHNYKRVEWPLIEILQRILRENVFHSAGHPSLFAYATKEPHRAGVGGRVE